MLALAGCGRSGFGALVDAAVDSALTDGASTDGRATDAPADAMVDVPMLGPCTKLALADDFDDGVMAASWTLLANNPVMVAENGQLQVTLATAGGAHYGGYDSTTTYDLRDHCMYVSFVTTPTNELNVEMTLSARTAAGSTGWVYHQGTIDPFVNTGTFMSYGAIPYDPTVQKILRVREDSGTMRWETSTDGVTFTLVTMQPTPMDVSAITVILEAGTFASAPSPGVATYDNFDVP